jgi:preprotein translocase subunit YajC
VSASLQYAVIVIALIGFWAIVVRPARRSQQRAADFQHDLAVGDDVIIASGIYGTVRSLEDGTVRLEIAPDTVITVARQAVVGRVPEPEDHSSSDSEN